jgi:hypothetical protein
MSVFRASNAANDDPADYNSANGIAANGIAANGAAPPAAPPGVPSGNAPSGNAPPGNAPSGNAPSGNAPAGSPQAGNGGPATDTAVPERTAAPEKTLHDAGWTVPAQRMPYRVNPSYPDAEGPTERIVIPAGETPAEIEDRAGRSWPSVLAIIIAVIALAVAGSAAVTAWQAFAKAGEAASMAHPAAATPVIVPSVVPSAAATTLPPMPTVFALKYAQEPLQVQAGCGTTALVDLDAPRVDPPELQGDLRYDNTCGADGPRLAVGPGALAGSLVADPDTDAPGCAEAIRTGPLEPGVSVPVQKGTAFCVLTSATGTPMVALVEVTGVDANGAASLRASAWSAAPDSSASPSSPSSPDSSSSPGSPGDEAGPDDAVPSDEATPGE